MTPSFQVALLEPDALARARLALALVRAGLDVIECADVTALYDALDRHAQAPATSAGRALTVYVRQAAYSPAMLAGLLPHLPQAYGVTVVAGVDQVSQEAGPSMGVSHCIEAARAAELLPLLDTRAPIVLPAVPSPAPGLAEPTPRLAPRDEQQWSTEAYGTWKVAHKGWVIINPLGDHIALTGVERNFFEALLGSERLELSRNALDPGQCGFALDSMSVLVSRLRKKVGAEGCPLPLHTVHGLGYVFIGSLVRVQHAPPAPLRKPALPAA